MTEESTSVYNQDSLAKYISERDYTGINYSPFGKPQEDLCSSCEAYYKILHNKGLTKKPFPPNCSKHILDYTKSITADDFETEEEYKEFIIASDPVLWAKYYFNWEARWYQREMMYCSSKKKVARCGRRCGKTLCITVLALWMLSTNKDYSILIVAPYEAQVIKIFDEMNRLIQSSPVIMSCVKRSTRNPCRLEFMNGSKAMGFSSGSKSAARSDKIRGQDANFIILDEADYLDETDIDAILAILASHPDCGLWASSTPTGQHKRFYQWCTVKDLGFKEFWYISAEAPNWTNDVEDFFRQSTDAVTYDHEYNAEFGIQSSGVFRNDLIDKALLGYSLPRPRTPGSKICIGVDWNGQAIGTHIVITEAVFNQEGQLVYLPICTKIIKGGEFSQHAAVEQVISLNDELNPEFIYVDAGYGNTQVEMLHKYGKQNPRSGLHKKVIEYQMGGSIKIRDPLNNKKIKKPAKSFLVNICVLQLEQGRIVLPVSEDTQILVDSTEVQESSSNVGLVQQMRNFSIERISITGLPTYSQGEEHTLTAWMLSIAAFVVEMSDMKGKISHSFPIGIDSPILPVEVAPHGSPSTQGERMAEASRTAGLTDGDIRDARRDTSVQRARIAFGDRKTIQKHYGRKLPDRTSKMRPNRWGKKGDNRSTF